MITGRYSIRI